MRNICPYYCSTDREAYCDATGTCCSYPPYSPWNCPYFQAEHNEEDTDDNED